MPNSPEAGPKLEISYRDKADWILDLARCQRDIKTVLSIPREERQPQDNQRLITLREELKTLTQKLEGHGFEKEEMATLKEFIKTEQQMDDLENVPLEERDKQYDKSMGKLLDKRNLLSRKIQDIGLNHEDQQKLLEEEKEAREKIQKAA